MTPALLRLSVLVVGALLTSMSTVYAQTVSEPLHRVQAGVGVGWLGGAALGDQPAELRTASGNPLQLFNSESELGSVPVFEVRATFGVSRRFAIDGRVGVSSPELRTEVSNDVEATGSAVALTEQLDQYVFEGGVVIRLYELETMGLLPFASAGAGYVRQLHEEQTLVEEGHLFYVGGGFTRVLVSRPSGLIRAVGLRADLRLDVISTEFDEDSQPHGSVAGSIVFTF
jgi:hypothetical protein